MHILEVKNVIYPRMVLDETDDGVRDFCGEVAEWLGMLAIGSPRILQSDAIDPYLSRFEAPRTGDEAVDVVIVSWTGFIPSKWITQLLVSCM